jgi:hypothetical protein
MPAGFAAIEDADDAGRLQSGSKARLAEKALSRPGSLRQMGVQKLDGDVEIEVAMPAAIDRPHAAFADAREEIASADAR